MIKRALRRSGRLIALAAISISFNATGVLATEKPDLVAAFRPLQGRQSKPMIDPEQSNQPKDDNKKRLDTAWSDHASIARNIAQCYYSNLGDPIDWPPPIRAILMLNPDEYIVQRTSYDPSGQNLPKTTLPVLNPFHAAAISFSDRVRRDRLEFGKELEDNRFRATLYQFLIVGLAASATILISARAIWEGNARVARTVGIFAIVASAAGAAVSSVNSFEGCQATVYRDRRALAQLEQLHWRIASDVLQKPQLCGEPKTSPDKATMEVANAWRARLEAILDSAVESISKPGDISGGAAPKDDSKTKS